MQMRCITPKRTQPRHTGTNGKALSSVDTILPGVCSSIAETRRFLASIRACCAHYLRKASTVQVFLTYQGHFQNAPWTCDRLHEGCQDNASVSKQRCTAAQGESDPCSASPVLCEAQEACICRLWGTGLCPSAPSHLSREGGAKANHPS